MITEEVWGGGAGIAVVVRGGAGIAVVVRGAGIAVVVRGDNCGCGVTLQLRHQHNAPITTSTQRARRNSILSAKTHPRMKRSIVESIAWPVTLVGDVSFPFSTLPYSRAICKYSLRHSGVRQNWSD